MQGEYRVKHENMIKRNTIAREIARSFKKINFKYIPKDLNKEADSLAKMALR